MNTKKYLAMFGELAEKGNLPRDVYDLMIAEIAKSGKMTRSIYDRYLLELEKRRLFDVDGAPFDTKNSAKTDGTYKYKKNALWYVGHAIVSSVFKAIGFIGGAIVFGVWRVKDRKKLKGIVACITTSNHVGYLDAVLSLRSTGWKRKYIVVAPHNCKRNFGGAILRSAGVVPLPISFKGTRPFNEAMDGLAAKKTAIHFYAEQSMWIGYRKPRPYKEGAFYYAERLNVPVVPMLYCFKDSRGLRKLFHLPKAVIKIGDPVYINTELSPRERKADMAARVFEATKAMYESFYGIPLEYEGDGTQTDITYDNTDKE